MRFHCHGLDPPPAWAASKKADNCAVDCQTSLSSLFKVVKTRSFETGMLV